MVGKWNFFLGWQIFRAYVSFRDRKLPQHPNLPPQIKNLRNFRTVYWQIYYPWIRLGSQAISNVGGYWRSTIVQESLVVFEKRPPLNRKNKDRGGVPYIFFSKHSKCFQDRTSWKMLKISMKKGPLLTTCKKQLYTSLRLQILSLMWWKGWRPLRRGMYYNGELAGWMNDDRNPPPRSVITRERVEEISPFRAT